MIIVEEERSWNCSNENWWDDLMNDFAIYVQRKKIVGEL